jgi:hypothetical protein
MHKFDDTEVTIDEIHDAGFGVKLKLRQETSWVKHVKFFYGHDTYNARLRWDENTGYTMFWDDVPPTELVNLSNRPEFEYVIDSYTELEFEDNYVRIPPKTINDIVKEIQENEATA